MNKYAALYEFNEKGLEAFEKVFTGRLPDRAIDPVDPSLAKRLIDTKSLEINNFETAKEMAQAVLDAIGTVKLFSLLPNRGLWGWLTFVMRQQLFKKSGDGTWKVGELHRWLPSDPNDWQKGQRHLVRMPVQLLDSLGNNADHLLCSSPTVLPDIREQLTSQQDMFHPSFQQVARALYYDDENCTLKRGAGGKTGGTPRRLAKVRHQLDITWDLEDLDPSRIIEMLPNEFSRFKPSSRS